MNHEHPIIPGITLGKRFYRNKNIWDSFNYIDLKCSITPLIGFGIGKFYNNKEEYYKAISNNVILPGSEQFYPIIYEN